MGKSLGNFITLPELFAGNHPKLEQAYNPMTVRFFILQAHYRSTLDFSNEALQAADKGLKRIMQAYRDLCTLAGVRPLDLPYGSFIDTLAPEGRPQGVSDSVAKLIEDVYEALCDDLNTPIALARLFDAVKTINSAKEGKETLSPEDQKALVRLFEDTVIGVMGLRDDAAGDSGSSQKVISGLMDMVLEQRAEAKATKDWAKSDAIRDHLKALGITVKDTKNGAEWTLE